MATKSLPCRLHGGMFTIEARRGRPPVKCGGDYPECSKAGATEKPRTRVVTKENTPSAAQKGRPQARPGSEAAKRAAKRPVAAAQKPRRRVETAQVVEETPEEVPTPDARSVMAATVALAQEAKDKLVSQGWTVTGRGYVDPVEVSPGTTVGGVPCAELIAARGDERITMHWRGDKLVDQQYSLWDMEQPHKNEMPEKGISSKYDEFTDKELVAEMAGQRVTWWNKLGKNKEVAFCPPDSVKIAHCYNGAGDETPADRIVTIVDHGGTGYRSFRVGQILKIG